MKWTTWVLCFLLIFGGVFCAIDLYRNITAKSYIRGSIDIQNRFTMESFNYVSTGVTLYHDLYDDTDTWRYSVDLKPVDDFNGAKNQYQLVINDYVLFGTKITAGAVTARLDIDFYNVAGVLVCAAELEIEILFLSNKTVLTMKTTGNAQASFLEQYFDDNGIRLYVNEILKGGLQ